MLILYNAKPSSRPDKYFNGLCLHGRRRSNSSFVEWANLARRMKLEARLFGRLQHCRRGPLAFDDLLASIIRATNVIVAFYTKRELWVSRRNIGTAVDFEIVSGFCQTYSNNFQYILLEYYGKRLSAPKAVVTLSAASYRKSESIK